MELSKYISRCRSPRVLENSRGKKVCVSCGKCPDCQARKLSKLTQKAVYESMDNYKTFMITLTYNYENIPTLLLKQCKQDDKYFIRCIDVTKRFVHPKNKSKNSHAKRAFKTYNEELHRINCGFNNPLFKEFYKKMHEKGSRIYKEKPFKWIPYLCKRDLQNFIKRLRFQISSEFNTEIRYFAVGEYSPTHFLPHFHIILYHNESGLNTELARLVDKCWEYGITDTQPALTNQGACSYVASYTNSFTTLPDFLNGVKIKPFSCHSQHFGTLYNAEIRDYVYSLDRYTFEPFDISINAGVRSVSLSSEISHSFFPRCYNYEQQDASGRYQLYTCFAELCKKYNYKRVVDLVKCVLVDYSDFYNTRLLSLIDLFPAFKSKSIDKNACFYKAFELSTKIQLGEDLTDEEKSIFNRLYSVINTSKLFDFNLQSPSLHCKMYNLNHYETRARYLIKMIDDFYHQKAQYDLSQQFFFQNEYYDRFSSDDYDIFYPIGCEGNYKDVYDSNKYIEQFNFEKDIMYRDKVKHKELNDANLIFVKNL